MSFQSRLAMVCLLAAAAFPACPQGYPAKSIHLGYPAKSIHLVVPWPPTGTVDILGRTLGQKLSENLAQSVIIDNRAGANGIIGSEAGAKSPPDGYTLVVDNITGHAINATPQEFSALLRSETEKWAKVVKISGARAE